MPLRIEKIPMKTDQPDKVVFKLKVLNLYKKKDLHETNMLFFVLNVSGCFEANASD